MDRMRTVLIVIALFATETSGKRPRRTRDDVPPPEINADGCECRWEPWMNNDDYHIGIGDDNTYTNLRRTHQFCDRPEDIKCREKDNWSIPFHILHTGGAKCDVTSGLLCVSRPYDHGNPDQEEKPFYCSDYEITVKCCTCPTTTTTTTTTTTATSTTQTTTSTPVTRPLVEASVKNTTQADKAPSEDYLQISVVLIAVFGFIAIAAFVIIIWILLTKFSTRKRRKIPREEEYEGPKMYNELVHQIEDETKPKVAIVRPQKQSTSDYVTSSSEDEGYRSRPRYSRKRKTKGERNRKLNSSRGEADDCFGAFPSLDLQPTTTESSDDGKFRKWFPDEYERSLQQKRTQLGKPKAPLFAAPFTSSSKKSIPFVDGFES